MPIQFFCPACHQPIEVDDEAANQSVTCPYCRKVVTAPFSSDPSVRLAGSQTAREAGPSIGPPSGNNLSPLGPGLIQPQVPQGRNVPGWISFICGTLCVLSILTAAVVFGTLLSKQGITQPDQMQEFIKEQQRSPSPQMLTASGLTCLAMVASLAGLILGIIGIVNKKQPRWPAIAGLVICAMLVLFVCVGAIINLSQMGAAGGG